MIPPPAPQLQGQLELELEVQVEGVRPPPHYTTPLTSCLCVLHKCKAVAVVAVAVVAVLVAGPKTRSLRAPPR